MKHVATYQGHFFTEPKYFRPHSIFIVFCRNILWVTRTLLFSPSAPLAHSQCLTRDYGPEMCSKLRYDIPKLNWKRPKPIFSFLPPSLQGVPRARQQRRRRLRHLVRGQGQDVPRAGNTTKHSVFTGGREHFCLKRF